MELLDLPLEILFDIVTWDPKTWKHAVLSIPAVYRSFDISKAKKKMTIRKKNVTKIHVITIYSLCGKIHREDGPAVRVRLRSREKNKYSIEYACVKEWHKHGKLHRKDGPAYIYLAYTSEDVAMKDENFRRYYLWKEGIIHPYVKEKMDKYISMCFEEIQTDRIFYYKEAWFENGIEKREEDYPSYLKLTNGYIYIAYIKVNHRMLVVPGHDESEGKNKHISVFFPRKKDKESLSMTLRCISREDGKKFRIIHKKQWIEEGKKINMTTENL